MAGLSPGVGMMGNIRPTYIKRVALELIRLHADRFSEDFEANKRTVDELTDVRFVTMRNRIAGYVTHLKRARRT